ncbi:hypothetical protein HA520_00970 [Azotobacter chroococcum]|uniref:Uncharacterized protein n=1 Tax=Azotobacter chroococcum TaxID=353 RepID=A0AA43Z3N2_9GAMM|nr:hypothetical protein [Azotobacter chroococcum]NHN75867.1 hypothetical protein [Azotobacter chroococcum]
MKKAGLWPAFYFSKYLILLALKTIIYFDPYADPHPEPRLNLLRGRLARQQVAVQLTGRDCL